MTRTIVVAAGDTLSVIAAANYGSAEYASKIAKYNGITNPDLLLAGETLELPAQSELDRTKSLFSRSGTFATAVWTVSLPPLAISPTSFVKTVT